MLDFSDTSLSDFFAPEPEVNSDDPKYAANGGSNGTALTPAEEFWVIKHGIKMSGMAAWGKTHSDALIWDMVALLQKLPSLSPAAYKILVRNAPADHDEMMKDMNGMMRDMNGMPDDHH